MIIMLRNMMIIILNCTINYSYLAKNKSITLLAVNRYISVIYLFVVAQNVGFLKRFAGL